MARDDPAAAAAARLTLLARVGAFTDSHCLPMVYPPTYNVGSDAGDLNGDRAITKDTAADTAAAVPGKQRMLQFELRLGVPPRVLAGIAGLMCCTPEEATSIAAVVVDSQQRGPGSSNGSGSGGISLDGSPHLSTTQPISDGEIGSDSGGGGAKAGESGGEDDVVVNASASASASASTNMRSRVEAGSEMEVGSGLGTTSGLGSGSGLGSAAGAVAFVDLDGRIRVQLGAESRRRAGRYVAYILKQVEPVVCGDSASGNSRDGVLSNDDTPEERSPFCLHGFALRKAICSKGSPPSPDAASLGGQWQ